jgi:hypothetical protein
MRLRPAAQTDYQRNGYHQSGDYGITTVQFNVLIG